MAKTSLIISSTDSTTGKKLQKTLTDINPETTNEQLKNLAQAFNAATTNTYVESSRVNKINVDTEDPTPLTKAFREATITGATRGGTATITYNVTTTQQGTPFVIFLTPSGSDYTLTYLPTTDGTTTDTQKSVTCTVPNSGGWLYVGLLAKETFYADFVSVEVS